MKKESNTAINLRLRLCRDYGATHQPSNQYHFFNIPLDNVDYATCIEILLIDSLYAALVADDPVVAFRSFIHAVKGMSSLSFSKYETAFYEARERVEADLEKGASL